MSDELVFYTNPMSRGRIVRWMLEEVGQPYRTELLEYATTMKAPEYLAINPMGKVPALRHGNTVITETAAICAYLADAFPAAGLAPPPGDRLRGPYYRWLFFAAGPLEAAWTNQVMGFIVPPDKQRMSGYGSFAAVIDVLEAAVSRGPYLAGDICHRRRHPCRSEPRLRHAVRNDRTTARVCRLRRTPVRAPCRGARQGHRR